VEPIQLTEVQALRLKLAIRSDELFKARLAERARQAQEQLRQAFVDIGLNPELTYALDMKAFTATVVAPPVQV